jgi:two-component system sensor histidine kinase/response regulator
MQKSRISVMYIDDERHNLYAFRAAFRHDYEIFLAESTEEARQILLVNEIPVIIADQRMPRETGVEFFESIKDTYPHSLRILLTGYTDIQSVITAVNLGNIYRYLQKPWQESEIREAIENAFEIYDSRIQLVEKNKELEKAYHELDKFVYSASHDMRSPLMSALGVVKLARLEADPSMYPQYFDMIERGIQQLDGYIRNIIGYYKSNRMELNRDSIRFEPLMTEVMKSLSSFPGFENYQISLFIEQEDVFITDQSKLEIAIANILRNALQYADSSKAIQEVIINIKSTAEQAEISISDNGIGIEAEKLHHIFKMFYRASSQSHGSGLGLYIAHDAISRLGGSIEASANESGGTRMHIALPVLS